jgi:hypothetical protein
MKVKIKAREEAYGTLESVRKREEEYLKKMSEPVEGLNFSEESKDLARKLYPEGFDVIDSSTKELYSELQKIDKNFQPP